MTFAALVIGSRVLRGLAPMVAAERCRVDPGRWLAWERGKAEPTRADLRRLEDGLDVDFGPITDPPRPRPKRPRKKVIVKAERIDFHAITDGGRGGFTRWLQARGASVPKGGGTLSTPLFADYSVWCETEGIEPLRRRAWGTAMGALFHRQVCQRGQYHRVVLQGMAPDLLPNGVARRRSRPGT